MPPRFFITRFVFGVCLVVPVVVLGWETVGRGQPVKPPAAAKEPEEKRTKLYFGTVACMECHKAGTLVTNPLCNCKEAVIWDKDDKHKLAYQVLTGDRAKEMAKKMGRQEKWTEDKNCLSCHSVYIDDPKLKEKSEEVNEGFRAEDGVSCVSCHGPYVDWYEAHSSKLKRVDWRKKTRLEKETDFGMKDLWTPRKRAALCLSCHVGSSVDSQNKEAYKVVTHEMYAAGHPPLPSVELTTLCNSMPPHWQPLATKNDVAKRVLQFNKAEQEQAHLVVEGGVTAFQESMRLLKDQAAKAVAKGEDDHSAGPLDLAQYDCYACHHDLKTPSWRQQRGYRGKPGRVPMKPWPAALVRLGIRQASGTDANAFDKRLAEFESRLKKLSEGFDARQYGNPKEIADAAGSLVVWCERLLEEIESPPNPDKTTYTRAASWHLLRELCASPKNVDYESARQIAWAFKVIYEELHPEKTGLIFEVLKQIDAELNLTLPAGQEKEILKELKSTLEKMSAYQPDPFAKRLAELKKLLEAEKP